MKDLLARHADANFIMCIGDDRTDEDMFKALLPCTDSSDACFTCKIGPNSAMTSARFGLKTSEEAVAMLGKLALISSERLNPSTI